MRERRRGFALLATLWVVIALAALGAAGSLAAHRAIDTSRNRVNLTRAAWRAEGCAEVARAVIDDALRGAASDPARGAAVWDDLDTLVAQSATIAQSKCRIHLAAAGSRLDINAADEEMLRALFRFATPSPNEADSLADALLDWRDADTLPRAGGAESAWYVARHRLAPRDGPFADRRELHRVRGFERLSGVDSLVDVEPGRVAINHAPAAVVAALPGLSSESVSRLVLARQRGEHVRDLIALAGPMSADARARLMQRYAKLATVVTTEPDAWILTATSEAGQPAAAATLQLRLVRAGSRAAIVRRRTCCP